MNTHAESGFEFDPPRVVTDATPGRDCAVFEVSRTLENFVCDTSDAAVAILFLVSCSLDRTLRIGRAPASHGHDG